MVRYPHTAKVSSDTGFIISGEWMQDSPKDKFITGRYEVVSTNNIIRVNPAGNEVVVRGEFYTQSKPIEGVSRLEITDLGIKKPIICWIEYQTHSVISV